MIIPIFKQWKGQPFGVFIVMLGYVITMLVQSMGVSLLFDMRENELVSTSGNPNHYMLLEILTENIEEIKLGVFFSILKEMSQQFEIQVSGIKGEAIKDTRVLSVDIIPVIYSTKPEWQGPLIKGRHLYPYETLESTYLAVVGKNVANMLGLYDLEDSNIVIEDEMYKVIGIFGKETRNTLLDNAVYIPLFTLSEQLHPFTKGIAFSTSIGQTNDRSVVDIDVAKSIIFVRKNGESPLKHMHFIESLFFNNFKSTITVRVLPEPRFDIDNKGNIITLLVIVALVIFISVINVVNLSLYWILNRQKEICVKKILGATNGYIIKSIFIEMLLIAIIAAFISLIIQATLIVFFNTAFNDIGINIRITNYNLLTIFATSVLCGTLTTFTPSITAIKMRPTEIINIV